MNELKRIFLALLGAVAAVCAALIALGRFAFVSIRDWWKSYSKWLRHLILVAVLSVPTFILALIGYIYYEEEYGRSSWNDYSISADVRVHCFNDGKYRVYNNETEEYTTPKFNWLSSPDGDDSLAVYAIDGRRGYINKNTGKIVVDARDNDYRKAWVFSEGLGAVVKDGMIGFINADNQVVIPFQYAYDYKDKCGEIGIVFHDGYCVMPDKDGNFGLIDTKGNWAAQPQYDEVWTQHSSGYRVVIDDRKYGLLDSVCNVVAPVEYEYISIANDGFVFTKDGKMWKEDFNGNMLRSFMFDYSTYINYPVECNESDVVENALSGYMKYEISDRYGIMDRFTGKPLTLAIYSEINMLSSDLFEVREYGSYKWYLIDTNGKVVER